MGESPPSDPHLFNAKGKPSNCRGCGKNVFVTRINSGSKYLITSQDTNKTLQVTSTFYHVSTYDCYECHEEYVYILAAKGAK